MRYYLNLLIPWALHKLTEIFTNARRKVFFLHHKGESEREEQTVPGEIRVAGTTLRTLIVPPDKKTVLIVQCTYTE